MYVYTVYTYEYIHKEDKHVYYIKINKYIYIYIYITRTMYHNIYYILKHTFYFLLFFDCPKMSF